MGSLFAEPLITEIPYTINSKTISFYSPFYRYSCQDFQNFHIQEQLQHKVTLKSLFAEPLFTEIQFGTPASDDFMMIESLVLEIPTALKTPKFSLSSSVSKDDKNEMNVDVVTKNNIDIVTADKNDIDIVNIADAVTAGTVDAENIAVDSPTVIEFRSDGNVDDVTARRVIVLLTLYSLYICT